MESIPASVVIVRAAKGWIAYVRYANRLLDQDIACSSKYVLERKVDYLFRSASRSW